MAQPYPQITFIIDTIDEIALTSQLQPDSNIENILYNLKNQTVWVPSVPYALKYGDSFSLYGKTATDFVKANNSLGTYGLIAKIEYYGAPTTTTTLAPTPTTTTTSTTSVPYYYYYLLNCAGTTNAIGRSTLSGLTGTYLVSPYSCWTIVGADLGTNYDYNLDSSVVVTNCSDLLCVPTTTSTTTSTTSTTEAPTTTTSTTEAPTTTTSTTTPIPISFSWGVQDPSLTRRITGWNGTITSINWGDGQQSDGPFNPPAEHTYPSSTTTYNVSVFYNNLTNFEIVSAPIFGPNYFVYSISNLPDELISLNLQFSQASSTPNLDNTQIRELYMNVCPNLTTVTNIQNLQYIDTIELSGCSINSSTMDSILAQIRNNFENSRILGTTKSVNFTSQNPAAIPSSQGIIDADYLVNNGWQVNFDGYPTTTTTEAPTTTTSTTGSP